MQHDPLTVDSRIRVLETNLRRLEMLRALSFHEFEADFRNIEAAKHLLQIAVEAMIDLAAHFVARLRLGIPNESAQLFMALADAGWLPLEHAERYTQMTRFRNLIVHLYVDVDLQQLYSIVQNDLDDFRTFIGDVRRIVKRASEA